MSLLPEKITAEVRNEFVKLQRRVKIIFFTQEVECGFCRDTRQLVEEVANLSPLIDLEIYDFKTDFEKAAALGVDKIPGMAVVGEQDSGIRFYGIPSGYEFTSFITAILAVGSDGLTLKPNTISGLKTVAHPVHIQVMVTPTCPYCPRAVTTAQLFALSNPNIRADMVEVSEFPQLVQKYGVQGVPLTIVNETEKLVGAVPEQQLLAAVLKTAPQKRDSVS